MNLIYLFINLTFIISGIILGIIILVNPVSHKPSLKKYRQSSKLLAASYLSVAIMNSAVLFFGLKDFQPEYFSFLGIVISSTQSLIFSYILIMLLSTHQNPKNNIPFIIHGGIILLFLIVFAVLSLFKTNPVLSSPSEVTMTILYPMTLLRIAFFAFYLYQIIRYCLIFRKAVIKYDASIGNYFSDTGSVKLNWVKVAFISALSIGLMAIIFQILPSLVFDNIFTSIVFVFYIGFAIKFINYDKIYESIEPAFDTGISPDIGFEKVLKKSSWDAYKQKVTENKLFLKEGITLIEMARLLNISRTLLSNFINMEEGQNFNKWINKLRISEAKHIMLNNPDYSISYIAIKTGFSEQSNFSREFKQVTGHTPSVWKKSFASSI